MTALSNPNPLPVSSYLSGCVVLICSLIYCVVTARNTKRTLLRSLCAAVGKKTAFVWYTTTISISLCLLTGEISYIPFSAGLASPHSAPGNLDSTNNSESCTNRSSWGNSTVDFSKVSPAAPAQGKYMVLQQQRVWVRYKSCPRP